MTGAASLKWDDGCPKCEVYLGDAFGFVSAVLDEEQLSLTYHYTKNTTAEWKLKKQVQ